MLREVSEIIIVGCSNVQKPTVVVWCTIAEFKTPSKCATLSHTLGLQVLEETSKRRHSGCGRWHSTHSGTNPIQQPQQPPSSSWLHAPSSRTFSQSQPFNSGDYLLSLSSFMFNMRESIISKSVKAFKFIVIMTWVPQVQIASTSGLTLWTFTFIHLL